MKYKNYKNKLTKTVRLAEKQYNADTFLQAKGNIKCTLQNINNFIINGLK